METIKVLDNKHVTLFYHEDKRMVHHVYKPTIGGEHLKEALNTGIELLQKHGANKWLSDNRAIQAHTEEEGQWVNNDWLPRAIDAGWKYWALVVPDNIMARFNMGEFIEIFHNMGVRVMVFTQPEDAMLWLEKVDQQTSTN